MAIESSTQQHQFLANQFGADLKYSAMTTEMILSPNITNVPQTDQQAPGCVFIQPPGTVQYIACGGYQLGNPGNLPQQQGNPPQQQHNPLQKLLKVETKTLGGIQIMIGLMHIGLGCIAIVMSGRTYISVGAISGYPIWGGIFFIISGSLAVSSERYLNGSLVRCSVGMNITSAIMALTGIILYIADLITSRNFYYYYDPHASYPYYYFSLLSILQSLHLTVGIVILLFSLLEFCITVSTAHFGCQAACCTNEPVTVFVPYTANFARVAPPESSPTPPNYHDVAHPPKMETE
nr:PREDICTED: membrane-spanning 4-domains subfamily A member 8 isoform X1 [Anolis carolinensis]|eukprot:XP_008114033.1 PREDICTED: membrane-spanning 4-domains subfamily A member 8 isoform X1 [Anolis carolinensis]